MLNGEVRIVEDVPAAFTALARGAMAVDRAGRPFHLGCSGGGSGRACFTALFAEDLDWSALACYFADERCVAPTSPDANRHLIAELLGAHLAELAGFHPMSCSEEPGAYEATLRAAGALDLLQLGLGPDGHTASLFPDSDALHAPPGRLVVRNHDPHGRNPFERRTLTYEGIALAATVVITVIDPARSEVLARIAAGEDLPATGVNAERLIWLLSPGAAAALDAP